MKNVTKIDQIDLSVFKKIRVAAYCRVSTDSEEQEVSLETQKNHYESYIRSNSEWEYVGVYYDESISGTKTAKRNGLKKLIDDCEKGLVDLILTKSISRFSRNTTDCLEFVRKLLNYDVYIQAVNMHYLVLSIVVNVGIYLGELRGKLEVHHTTNGDVLPELKKVRKAVLQMQLANQKFNKQL